MSEAVATFGLIVVILTVSQFTITAVSAFVGLYIISAYWFTASTSFANPAVAIARSLTDTFAGICPQDLPGFLIAQFLGAFIASAMVGWFLGQASGLPRAVSSEHRLRTNTLRVRIRLKPSDTTCGNNSRDGESESIAESGNGPQRTSALCLVWSADEVKAEVLSLTSEGCD